jgi:anti-repressor protein
MQDESKVFRTFFYQGNQIRTVEHNGETWWVASDVCKVLEITNVSLAVNGNDGTGNIGLDEDEKDYIMIHICGRDTAGYTLRQRTRPVSSHQQKSYA